MTGMAVSGYSSTLPGVSAAVNPATVMEEHAVMPEHSFSATVIVYDVTGLLPVSKELASKYK